MKTQFHTKKCWTDKRKAFCFENGLQESKSTT